MKSLIITESEKKRILQMHQSATNRNYLNEVAESPQLSAPPYGVALYGTDVRWSFKTNTDSPRIYLYGDATGNEATAGYFQTKEKYKIRLFYTRTSMQAGTINWSVTWTGEDAGGGGTGSISIPPIDQQSYNQIQACKKDGKSANNATTYLNQMKAVFGAEFCSWYGFADIEITMPIAPGTSGGGTKNAGNISFAGSQGIISAVARDGKTVAATSITLTWPANTTYGVGGKAVTPKATTTTTTTPVKKTN